MKTIKTLLLIAIGLIVSQFSFAQVQPSSSFFGTIDQSGLNPYGVPLDPNGSGRAQVNANFGGLIFQSLNNTSTIMNMIWGQNFDYHSNSDIRYRINGPVAQQQMTNGSIYFYTAPTGVAGQQILNFAFKPKVSIANNGGLAIGNTYAIANVSNQGTLLVENNIGLGTQNPTAQLHTTGTVRFQGLTTGGSPNNFVGIDANGQLWRLPLTTGIQNLCASENFITKSTTSGNLSCSQLYDNGVSVGINQTSNFNYSGLTVVGSNIPPSTGTAKLAVNGVVTALAYYATSDEKMKKNIENIHNALEKIKALNGKSYLWNTNSYSDKGMDANKQLGFMAQDLANVLPEVVIKKNDGTYAVNYNGIIPVITEGIKEQQVTIEELKNDIVNLKNDIGNLKSEISNLSPKINSPKNDSKYFSISPNPFNNQTKINYNLGSTTLNVVCLIYDLQGKIIKRTPIPSGTAKGSLIFSKDNLPSGVYFVSFLNNNQEIQVEKVILTN